VGLHVSGRYERVLWALVALGVAFVLSRVLALIVGRIQQRRPEGQIELRRLRRDETALTLVATALPYLVLIGVGIVIATTFLPGTAAALGGSAFVLLLVGFGGQRFLMDVIAGSLILIEGWYGVGDFVRLFPTDYAGVVEQLSLRTTVLRLLNGDRCYVPNSQIIGAARSPAGYRRYSIELLTSDPESARNAIETAGRRAPVGEARYLRAPHVVEERALGDGVWLVRGVADVPPTLEWLAESLLVSTLKALLDHDDLIAEPIVYTLDESALSRYERRVLLR
jgi:moderate conductance mechanosensitive channel